MVKLKDIGEHELLKIINQYCDYGIACDFEKKGDDGAIIQVNPHKKLIVTTDVLVENVHFSDRTTPPHSIGYRAVTANLSDIAAMGGMPLGITVGLSLNPQVDIHWIQELYRGMKECLTPYNISIIGGDITRSSINGIAITALGEVSPSQIIYRHQAKPRNLILITGDHGLSKAGLELLLYPHKYEHLNREIKDKVIFAHQYPKPRLDIIKPLQEATSHFNKEELIIAGMDSSDGLADALIQICQQSQVGAKIDLTQLSIPPEILAMVDEETAWNWLLYGGEDFELVLSVSPSLGDYLLKQFPSQYKCLGEITENNNIEINSHPKFLLNQKKTFQHF